MSSKHDATDRTELPDYPDNRALLAYVRPDNWQNPDPAPMYNLVVLGAGPAGLSGRGSAAMIPPNG
jgi:hypothetical protein